MVLFFKQQTSYDMRISDWSSDVCSTDLGILAVYAPPLVWRDEVQDNVRMAVSVHGIEHGRDAFGIDGRPVYPKGLAECPPPRMILVQLLAPCKNAPLDELNPVCVRPPGTALVGLQPPTSG